MPNSETWVAVGVFKTRFLQLIRKPDQLKECKISQKNLLAILRRMVYNLITKSSYLTSENDEIGRFWSIWRLSRDFS